MSLWHLRRRYCGFLAGIFAGAEKKFHCIGHRERHDKYTRGKNAVPNDFYTQGAIGHPEHNQSYRECAVKGNAAISHQSPCIRQQTPSNDAFDAVKVTERLRQLHLWPNYPEDRLSCHIGVWRHGSEDRNGLNTYVPRYLRATLLQERKEPSMAERALATAQCDLVK